MSHSTLYRVFPDRTESFAEFPNGWGTAPVVWDYLCKTFLDGEQWLFGNDRLWKLSSDERVPRALRLVHAFIFDRAVCPLDRVAELADACEEAGLLLERNSNRVNHWRYIGNALRKHVAVEGTQVAVALNSTSVNDVWCDWTGGETYSLFDALVPVAAKEGQS